MMIIGSDFHPSWQQVSWLDTETGETGEQKLVTAAGDAEGFYRKLEAPALVGMEATGNCHWLVDLLNKQGHELWVGDAAQIRASYVRQQKTDKRDAEHILKLLVEGRFPRIWMPSSEVRDLAAAVAAPLQAGDHSGAGEKRTATPLSESGSAEEAQAVE